ncbi:hypothetical protein PVAND_011993 [Polypedilum vanderplanki]|uniref:Uncharacterized protein n=1 Tax=Polypedilum vanderplanki TaxID=319348 RepID=A0A9J6CM22_POLVA|nr:hypothetical protein PVAND_011993 [Polypedilum vanderplanki]
MKLQFILPYIFFWILSHYNLKASILNCEISCETEYQVIGKICRCKIIGFDSASRETITEIAFNQQHFSGNLTDIKLLLIDEQVMKFFPSNLYEFFPNLQGLIIDSSQLSSISKNDLRNFPNLRMIFIGNNKIDELHDDLFEKNLSLEWITFLNNFTKKIGSEILNSLSKLEFANFMRNSCVSYKAIGNAEIEKLKVFIKRDCTV